MIKTILKQQILTIFSDGSSIKNTTSFYFKNFKFLEKDFKDVQLEYKQNQFLKGKIKKSSKFNYRKNLFK